MAIDRVKTKANAEKFLKANRIPEAIRELQKLADDNPRDIQVLNQIGQLHLRQGNKDLAVPCFLKVADLFTKQGFFTKAVASLKIVTREAPENLAAWEMLASLSEQQGFAREAWGAYEKVAELYSQDGEPERRDRRPEEAPRAGARQPQGPGSARRQPREGGAAATRASSTTSRPAASSSPRATSKRPPACTSGPSSSTPRTSTRSRRRSRRTSPTSRPMWRSSSWTACWSGRPGPRASSCSRRTSSTRQRQFSEAETVCRTVMETNRSSSGAMFRLVRALVMQQRIDDASSAVREWLKACGPAKVAEAEALYEEILRFTAGHVLSLKGLVETARLSGKARTPQPGARRAGRERRGPGPARARAAGPPGAPPAGPEQPAAGGEAPRRREQAGVRHRAAPGAQGGPGSAACAVGPEGGPAPGATTSPAPSSTQSQGTPATPRARRGHRRGGRGDG